MESELVTVCESMIDGEAEACAAALRAYGFDVLVLNDRLADAGVGAAGRTVRVQVAAADAERARETLQDLERAAGSQPQDLE